MKQEQTIMDAALGHPRLGTEENEARSKSPKKSKLQPQASSGIRITLPEEIGEKVGATLKILKERGCDVKPEEVLKPVLATISQEYLDRVLREFTPDDYYLEQARNLPEVRAGLIRAAKRAILRGKPAKPRKTRRRSSPNDGLGEEVSQGALV